MCDPILDPEPGAAAPVGRGRYEVTWSCSVGWIPKHFTHLEVSSSSWVPIGCKNPLWLSPETLQGRKEWKSTENYSLWLRLWLSWNRGGVGWFWHKVMSPFKEIETGSPASPP